MESKNKIEDEVEFQKQELLHSFREFLGSISSEIRKNYGCDVFSVLVNSISFKMLEYAYPQVDLDMNADQLNGIDIDFEDWLSAGDILIKFGNKAKNKRMYGFHSIIISMDNGEVKYCSLQEEFQELKDNLSEIISESE